MEKQFYDIAKNNWNNGQQLETMGYLIGFESNDTLIATEIIIPTQTGSSDMVVDNGKSIIKLLLTSMLRMPRQNSTLKTSFPKYFNKFNLDFTFPQTHLCFTNYLKVNNKLFQYYINFNTL